jgi:hypothetical protein
MKRFILAILITLNGNVLAQTSALKPGLWEMKVVRQVVDGRDMSAELASGQARMQQGMANMSPAQRSQMEAMMSRQNMPGAGSGGSRMCISPEMAARNKPMIESDGRCDPTKLSRAGNTTSFEFNCTSNGRTSVGKGESTASGNVVQTRLDMTVTDAKGTHTMQRESQLTFLGTDCQGVTPVDRLGKGAQAPSR